MLVNIVVLLVWFPGLKKIILNWLGLNISGDSKLGLSLYLTTDITMLQGSSIGHFNYIKCSRIKLGKNAGIGHLNYMKGSYFIEMEEASNIGNQNIVKNNYTKNDPETCELSIGHNSKITSAHYLDMSASVVLGSNTVLGGRSSFLWTHGFVHFNEGLTRLVKIEPIVFKSGVYIWLLLNL